LIFLGLKYAYNTSFSDCKFFKLLVCLSNIVQGAVIIIKTLLDVTKEEKQETLLSAVQNLLNRWGVLLTKFIMTDDDQVELIWGIQDFCEQEGKERYRPIFPIILHSLYDKDILAEDSIWQWVEEAKEAQETTFVKLVSI
jgi:translation initiation factor eIF-2B subunit epsilon